MAAYTETRHIDGFFSRLWEALRVRRARQAEYYRVRAELMALSTRDLHDIGISRNEIEDIARRAGEA